MLLLLLQVEKYIKDNEERKTKQKELLDKLSGNMESK